MEELWIDIAGYEGAYQVSTHGRVRSIDRDVNHRAGGIAAKIGKILLPRKDGSGYLFVSLSAKSKAINAKIHRLVAQHFLDSSGMDEVNHKDFDKCNNSVDNLEWTTRKGNQVHASNGGRFSASTNPKRAKKLTPEIVVEIRSARNSGLTYAALALKFGISAPTALKVVRGEIWA